LLLANEITSLDKIKNGHSPRHLCLRKWPLGR
jgi:hypothetical protein